MKYTNENIQIIEKWLDDNKIVPSLDEELIRRITHSGILPNTGIMNSRDEDARRRFIPIQYSYTRMDLLKLIHKKNKYSAEGIKAGYVYAITNPAWPDYVKIGSSIDVDDRLSSYQTSSPLRDYRLENYFFSYDRKQTEKEIHSMFDREGEWCRISKDELRILFSSKKIESHIKPEENFVMSVFNQGDVDIMSYAKRVNQRPEKIGDIFTISSGEIDNGQVCVLEGITKSHHLIYSLMSDYRVKRKVAKKNTFLLKSRRRG